MASIKQINGKNGVSFKITVSMGRDAKGRQRRHYMTWKPDRNMTQRQISKTVAQVAYEFERELQIGFQADNRQTFEKYAEYVYSLREQKGDKPQTLARVRRQTERINEYIGHMRITDIRPQHLNKLYKKLSEPGANRWQVFAAPAIDFKELVGNGTYNDLAAKCGVYGRLICRLCNNQYISLKNAKIIEQHLGRKNLFQIVGTHKPLAPGTIRDYHGVIYTVLAQAEKEMIIPYNPAERATLPAKKRVRESKSLQPDQLKKVLSALKEEPLDFQAKVNILIVTGCRRGEMYALKESKIDFERNEILIDRSLSYLPDRGVYEGPTKTESARYIAIPQQTVDLLKEYLVWKEERRIDIDENYQDSGYLFTRANGQPLNPCSLNVELDNFSKKHGLPHLNPHLFRHTCASILLSNGVDVLTVSKLLGHADVSTTTRVYAHEIEQARRKTATCISETILL